MRRLLWAMGLWGCGHAAHVPPTTPQGSPAADDVRLGPITARDGLLPWVATDGGGGCDNRALDHLEIVRVADGTTAWTSKQWGQIIGELGDGDLVVTNFATLARDELVVAALARADGAMRWSCRVPMPAKAVGAWWVPEGHRATGRLVAYDSVGGPVHPPAPVLPAVRVDVTAAGCTIVTHGVAPPAPLPAAPLEWSAGDLVIRYQPPTIGAPNAGPTTGPLAHLVATRADQPVWTHDLPTPRVEICAAP